MSIFDVIFWVLLVLSITGAASIHFGWIILFLFLALLS